MSSTIEPEVDLVADITTVETDIIIIEDLLELERGPKKVRVDETVAPIISYQEEMDALNVLLQQDDLIIQKVDEMEEGDCFYKSVIIGINNLPYPFNISYSVEILRHKIVEYMKAHSSRFKNVLPTPEMLSTYCDRILNTRKWACSTVEFPAMAHALQVKIILIYIRRGNKIEETYGLSYKYCIRIAFNHRGSEFSAVVRKY